MIASQPTTLPDTFCHKLSLSVSDKLLFLLCSVFLVPLRLSLALLVAFLIWLSSTLGLLFRDPDTWDDSPQQGWRKVFQNCMWTTSGYVIFWALGFRWPHCVQRRQGFDYFMFTIAGLTLLASKPHVARLLS